MSSWNKNKQGFIYFFLFRFFFTFLNILPMDQITKDDINSAAGTKTVPLGV